MKNMCHTGQKTLCEKEKLLVTSNFSFSHNVFHRYISLGCQNAALCGNGLRFESQTDLIFLPCICSFVSLLLTLFVRLTQQGMKKKNSEVK